MDQDNLPNPYRGRNPHNRRSLSFWNGLQPAIALMQRAFRPSTRRGLVGVLVGLCLFMGCMPSGLQLPSSSDPPASPVASTAAPAPRAAIPPAPAVDPAKLMAHVQALAFERARTADRDRTRAYITTQLQQMGWTVEAQAYEFRPASHSIDAEAEVRVYTGTNLVAHRNGQVAAQERVLVGAHYDTVPGSPGADDNATGVAIALEMARIFSQSPTPRTLTLAFFDQEELGLVGSSAFVEQEENRTGLQGAIILEMLGYTCEQAGCQRVPAELGVTPPSSQGDFVAIVADREHQQLLEAFKRQNRPAELPLLSLAVPFKGALTPIVLLSDHTPFWLNGMGGVMVTDTAFLRNPHYHQRSDRPASLNPEFLAKSAQLVADATNDLLHG